MRSDTVFKNEERWFVSIQGCSAENLGMQKMPERIFAAREVLEERLRDPQSARGNYVERLEIEYENLQ
jgi:hypothetical protein